ncbi:MAG: sulfatase-like hydrolase/transferase [Planctomycetota bacterium]|nr:sulfatase-like hydrolase/transferase [Planctomycetota bacterium]
MAQPLNILLITTDQQRGDCLGIDGNPVLHTPYLDGLARAEGGAFFSAAYAEAPACVPQRTAWMLGQHPLTCGQNRWRGREWKTPETLTGCLAEQGYRVGVFGKRHFLPVREPYGAHELKIYESGRHDEDPDDFLLYLRRETEWGGYSRAHAIGNNDIFAAASPLPEQHHPSTWTARESAGFLERHAKERPGQPFFLWTSFNKPHSPYDPPQPYDRMYRPQDMPGPAWFEKLEDEIGPSQRAARHYTWDTMGAEQVKVTRAHYYGMISHIDLCIGRVLKKLDQYGLRENTVIAFTSDHGDMLGDHHMYFKGNFFEGASRVPYVWWVPPKRGQELNLKARGRVAAPVGVSTLGPSLLEAAGAEKPKTFDAGSVLPWLQESRGPAQAEVVTGYGHDKGHTAMLRWERFKYLYWQPGDIRQLFDMQADPGEMNNLALKPEHKALAAEAHARLERRLAEYPFGRSEVLDAGGKLRGLPEPTDAFRPRSRGRGGAGIIECGMRIT